MKSGKRRPAKSMANPPEERDWTLTVILLVFNIISGATTIIGASQILPKELAWGLGFFVQLLLFFLLGDFTAKHAPIRKWIAVIVFTFVSVYTSFFAYYKVLATDKNNKLAYDRAASAHQQLVSKVFTPIEQKLNEITQEATTLKSKVDAERNRGLNTGLTGYGPEARRLDRLALEKQAEADSLKATVEKIRPKFNYDIKGKEPIQILEADRIALASVPPDLRNNYPDLDRNTYIDQELEVSLLAPYYKIRQGEEAAISSLAIAFMVDFISLMLGTAITKKRGRSPLLIFGQFLSNRIKEVKAVSTQITDAINEQNPPVIDPNYNSPQSLTHTVNTNITCKLHNKGSVFLDMFRKAISQREPFTIDNSRFVKDKDSQEFNRFLEKLSEIGWVNREASNNYCIPRQYHSEVNDWLESEIECQRKQEKLIFLFTNVEKTEVKFRIYSSDVSSYFL